MGPVTPWPSPTRHHEACDLGYVGNSPTPTHTHACTHTLPALGLSTPRSDFQARSYDSAPCSRLAARAGDSRGSHWPHSQLFLLPSNTLLAIVRACEEHQAHPSSNPGHGETCCVALGNTPKLSEPWSPQPYKTDHHLPHRTSNRTTHKVDSPLPFIYPSASPASQHHL